MNYDAKLLHQKFGNLNQGHWGEVSPEWITISSQDTVPTVQNFTKRNLALQHVIFMNFVCWKIHGPWQWDSPWQVRSLNPAPLVQDLMAPNWRDPCLWCAYFVMVLATSSLLTSCGYISFHHHLHYTSWYFMACWRNTHDHLDYWLLRDTYSNRFSQNMWPRTGTHQSERKRNSPSTIWGAQRQHHIKLIINGTPWFFAGTCEQHTGIYRSSKTTARQRLLIQ